MLVNVTLKMMLPLAFVIHPNLEINVRRKNVKKNVRLTEDSVLMTVVATVHRIKLETCAKSSNVLILAITTVTATVVSSANVTLSG